MTQYTTLNNILLPTDFSELAGNALITAIEMCRRHNAVLHLLHVVENRFLVAPSDVNISAIYVVPEMEATAKKNLRKLADGIREKHAVKIETHLEFGTPSFAISEKAIGYNCDLIVMGTHGTSGFREFFIGSNAYAVIKNTGVPVLTIPGNKPVKSFEKIIFPIRLSKGIREKYDFIAPVIQKNNASLVVAGLSKPGEAFDKNTMQEEINDLTQTLSKNEINFKTFFYECRNMANKVLEIARDENADLIVINATLDYKWRQFFIGPYAQQLVHHAKVPVLSIRTASAASAFADAVKDEVQQSQDFKLAF